MVNNPEGGAKFEKTAGEQGSELIEEEKEELASFTFGHLVEVKRTNGEVEHGWVVVSSAESISSESKKFVEENKDRVIVQKREPGSLNLPFPYGTVEKVIPREELEKFNPSAGEAEDRPFSKRFINENMLLLQRRIESGEEKEGKMVELRSRLDELEEKLTIVEKQEEIKAEKIAQAKAPGDLEETVKAMGLIENEKGNIYNAERMASIIKDLRDARYKDPHEAIAKITRTYGLRRKVMEFFN